MSIESRSRQYGKVFDHWQIREFLGSGSGGKSAVFRLVHTDSSSVKSALKVISLIEKRGSLKSLSVSLKAEYESAKKKCKDYAKQEVLLMNGLQGQTNVVAYQDHTFVDWEDETGFGCDMLIRMELLTDLRSQLENAHVFNEKDVLKIGRDICAALVLCHSKNILHRDIKPENIFFNNDGNYKLGDFGVSRILNAAPMSKASTGVCTIEYAAPEQLSGKYDTRVDIYSLGLVLYELSNNNRLPFASSYYITRDEVQQRFLGKPLPAPQNASKELSDVILKACAHNPDDRYQTAEDFLADLNYLAGVCPRPNPKSSSLSRTTEKATPGASRYVTQRATADEVGRTGRNDTVPTTSGERASSRHYPRRHDKTTIPKGLIIGIVCALVVAIGFAVSFGVDNAKKQDAINSYLDEANAAATSSDYVAALAKIEEGLTEYPDSDELQAKKDTYSALIEQEIATIVTESDMLVAEDNYVEAISKIESALITYPNNSTLLEKKDEYNTAYSTQIKETTLKDAQAFADAGDYKSAMDLIQSAQSTYGDDTEYQSAYDKYHQEYLSKVRNDAITQADQMAANGNYLDAIKKIEDALVIIGDDSDLSQRVKDYENTYVRNVISETDDLMESAKHSEALVLVKDALKQFPSNADLLAQQNVIMTTTPKSFMDVCLPYQKNNNTYFYEDGKTFSMSGESYRDGITMKVMENSSWFLSNLKQEYSIIQFYLGHVDGTGMTDATLSIYLDDTFYASYDIPCSGLPQLISIPVTEVAQLKVVASSDFDDFGGYPYIGLGNITIQANHDHEEIPNPIDSSAKRFLDACSPYEKNNNTFLYADGKTFDMSGESYRDGITMKVMENSSWFMSNLKKDYSIVQFYLGHVDGSGMTDATISIYLDDEFYMSYDVPCGGLPVVITIPVSNVSQLKIVGASDFKNFGGYPYIGFGNMSIK